MATIAEVGYAREARVSAVTDAIPSVASGRRLLSQRYDKKTTEPLPGEVYESTHLPIFLWGNPVSKAAIVTGRPRIVVLLTHGLPISWIPEQAQITLVRNPMVHNVCRRDPQLPALAGVAFTQRMLCQEVHASDAPAARAVQRSYRIILPLAVYLALAVPFCLVPGLGAEGAEGRWTERHMSHRDVA